jgi:hypothetical protein
MKPVYSDQSVLYNQPSIFLAGPTPRAGGPESWRKEALLILDQLEFKDNVFIPEPSDGRWPEHYEEQVGWEYEALHACGLIVFWVPRSELMPGFTTNVEFGYWLRSGKILYGRPDWSIKNRYLDSMYEIETGMKPYDNLQSLLAEAVNKLK